MRNKIARWAQIALEYVLAFIAIALLVVGIIRIGIWFNANYANREAQFQNSRLVAGQPINYDTTFSTICEVPAKEACVAECTTCVEACVTEECAGRCAAPDNETDCGYCNQDAAIRSNCRFECQQCSSNNANCQPCSASYQDSCVAGRLDQCRQEHPGIGYTEVGIAGLTEPNAQGYRLTKNYNPFSLTEGWVFGGRPSGRVTGLSDGIMGDYDQIQGCCRRCCSPNIPEQPDQPDQPSCPNCGGSDQFSACSCDERNVACLIEKDDNSCVKECDTTYRPICTGPDSRCVDADGNYNEECDCNTNCVCETMLQSTLIQLEQQETSLRQMYGNREQCFTDTGCTAVVPYNCSQECSGNTMCYNNCVTRENAKCVTTTLHCEGNQACIDAGGLLGQSCNLENLGRKCDDWYEVSCSGFTGKTGKDLLAAANEIEREAEVVWLEADSLMIARQNMANCCFNPCANDPECNQLASLAEQQEYCVNKISYESCPLMSKIKENDWYRHEKELDEAIAQIGLVVNAITGVHGGVVPACNNGAASVCGRTDGLCETSCRSLPSNSPAVGWIGVGVYICGQICGTDQACFNSCNANPPNTQTGCLSFCETSYNFCYERNRNACCQRGRLPAVEAGRNCDTPTASCDQDCADPTDSTTCTKCGLTTFAARLQVRANNMANCRDDFKAAQVCLGNPSDGNTNPSSCCPEGQDMNAQLDCMNNCIEPTETSCVDIF